MVKRTQNKKGSKVASERKVSDLVLIKYFLGDGEKSKSSVTDLVGREFDLISGGKNLPDC